MESRFQEFDLVTFSQLMSQFLFLSGFHCENSLFIRFLSSKTFTRWDTLVERCCLHFRYRFYCIVKVCATVEISEYIQDGKIAEGNNIHIAQQFRHISQSVFRNRCSILNNQCSYYIAFTMACRALLERRSTMVIYTPNST